MMERLQKILSARGVASRRHSEELIRECEQAIEQAAYNRAEAFFDNFSLNTK